MKCRLGPKKVRRIEKLTGKKVAAAFVRGGWRHYWAEVFFEGEKYTKDTPMVNYKTGEVEYPDEFSIKYSERKPN